MTQKPVWRGGFPDAIGKFAGRNWIPFFSPTIPPLGQLQNIAILAIVFRAKSRPASGWFLGARFALGPGGLHARPVAEENQEILSHKRKYLESAVRDAHACGAIYAPDPAEKARMILASAGIAGLSAPAHNVNVRVLRDTARGIFAMLGVKEKSAAAA